MFEAKLLQGSLLKKILDAMKDFVKSANWNCTSDGIALQVAHSSSCQRSLLYRTTLWDCLFVFNMFSCFHAEGGSGCGTL